MKESDVLLFLEQNCDSLGVYRTSVTTTRDVVVGYEVDAEGNEVEKKEPHTFQKEITIGVYERDLNTL